MFSIIYMNRSYTLAGFILTAAFHHKRHITPEPMFIPRHVPFSSLKFYYFLFVVHFRSSVAEKSPGESLALQLVQVELRCDDALAVAVHGLDHLSGTVRDEGGAVEFQG